MAVLWSRQVGDTHYEIRSAGASRRLYTNGVLHTQFNPRQPVTGSVWDLLLLPAFFHYPSSVRRVLVLGVGGGAVLRQLRAFVDPETLIGVDIERVHLRLARRHFGVTPKVAELVHADARDWLAAYDGPPFDLIIDDLFGHVNGEPVRALPMTVRWARALSARLSRRGILVANFPERRTLRESALATSPAVRRTFATGYTFTTPLYENVVAACLRDVATPAELHDHLAAVPLLDTRRRSCRLRFRVTQWKEA